MKHFTAKSAVANFIKTLNTVDLEFMTTTGEQVIVSLPAGAEVDLLEGDEHAIDTTRSDTSLHLDSGDRLERPALRAVVVENLLELVAGHLAADESLTKLDHLVLRHSCLPSMLRRRTAASLGSGH